MLWRDTMTPVRAVLPTALFLLVLLPGQAGAVENARELATYCESAQSGAVGSGREVEIPNTKEALLCWGYLEAFQDLSVLVDQNGARVLGVCPPEHGTLLDLVRLYVRYARAHRRELPESSAVAVINALQDAYPCSPTGAPSPAPTRN
jgi:Rap1a immunity proteins